MARPTCCHIVATVSYSRGMKSETQGFTLTEIPGIESITIEPDPASAGGVHVVIVLNEPVSRLDYGMAEAEELSTAIEHACRLASNLAHEIEVNGR